MYETINRAVIAVATDDTVREELHAAHLRLKGRQHAASTCPCSVLG